MVTTAGTPYPSSSTEPAAGSGSSLGGADPLGPPGSLGSTTGSTGSTAGSTGATQADATTSSSTLAGDKKSPLRGENDLLARVVQGAHDTIDRLAESAAPRVQRLQEGVSSANEVLHSRADQARDMGDEWAESLRCTVRENPLASVAAALAIGIVIARLTS